MPARKGTNNTQLVGHLDSSQNSSTSTETTNLSKESLDCIRILIRTEFKESFEKIEKVINELKTENTSLKRIIASQQLALEKIEMDRRTLNLVIKGLPEPTSTISDTNQVTSLLEAVRIQCDSPPPSVKFQSLRRVGKIDPNRPRLLVATFSHKSDKELILKNAKCLKNSPTYGKTYFSPDLPELTRKENTRLYLAAKSARLNNPADTVLLQRGKLLINGTVQDSFDLQNQLFL
jgi:hypothetical protein